ncbi:MAG TPA: N-acetyltransferase [Terriglobia bacterium]|nr:N-acetyltransferase [Terriglobia bacterium]
MSPLIELEMIEIRKETPDDFSSIRHVNERAFGGSAEAQLVELLRAANKAVVSLVALDQGRVVGHILFSPISVAEAPEDFRGAGLAPMSVLPEFQNKGIGSRLVRDGLEACKQKGYGAVVVLGHTAYYPRFGFSRAKDYRLDNEYNALDAFMVIELKEGALQTISGMVKYAPEFSEVGS